MKRMNGSRGLVLLLLLAWRLGGMSQTPRDSGDVWREVELEELDYQKERNYCVRLYGYYRYTDEGTALMGKRRNRVYRVREGICEVDVRYDRKEDEGAEMMVGRDLVHPDRGGDVMDFYELKPYTILELARRQPKRFTVEERGDTTLVYSRQGLVGTAVRDTLRGELRIGYQALAPDTMKRLNLVVVRGELRNVWAEAVYGLGEEREKYVPQGNLKNISFEGDMTMELYPGMGVTMSEDRKRGLTRVDYHERSEFYIDSVAYLTRQEYRADRKLTLEERRARAGYVDADIDRLRLKLGVPPLSAEIRRRIEDQLDWEDMYDHWEQTNGVMRTLSRSARKMADSETFQDIMEKASEAAEHMEQKARQKTEEKQ